MARISAVTRVNETDISNAPRATEDIYIDAVDPNGRPIGFGKTLVAQAGQLIPAAYLDHPAVRGSKTSSAEAPAATPREQGEGTPAGDDLPALSTLNKPELIELAEQRGIELEGGETVADLRDMLKADADGDADGDDD